MNDPRSPERLLAAWLATEAPPRPPAGLRDDILSATARVRPRPGWLARLKGNHMDVIVGGRARPRVRFIPLLALLGLLLAALVGAAVVGSQLLQTAPTVPVTPARFMLPAPVVEVIVGDDGSIWASTTTEPALQARLPVAIHRVDPATGGIETVVNELPDGHVSFVVVEGSIWASTDASDRAIRWDATSGAERQTVPLGTIPLEPIAAYGWVWHPNFGDGTITRIEPETGDPTLIDTGWVQGPRGLGKGGGLVWAVSPGADWVIGIDPATATIATEIHNLSFLQACGIGFALERVWVFQCEAARAEVFDPTTGESLGVFEPADASRAGGVFEHDGRAWLQVVSGVGQVSVVAVDPTSLDVVAEYDTGLTAPETSAVGPDALWLGIESELVSVPFAALPER